MVSQHGRVVRRYPSLLEPPSPLLTRPSVSFSFCPPLGTYYSLIFLFLLPQPLVFAVEISSPLRYPLREVVLSFNGTTIPTPTPTSASPAGVWYTSPPCILQMNTVQVLTFSIFRRAMAMTTGVQESSVQISQLQGTTPCIVIFSLTAVEKDLVQSASGSSLDLLIQKVNQGNLVQSLSVLNITAYLISIQVLSNVVTSSATVPNVTLHSWWVGPIVLSVLSAFLLFLVAVVWHIYTLRRRAFVRLVSKVGMPQRPSQQFPNGPTAPDPLPGLIPSQAGDSSKIFPVQHMRVDSVTQAEGQGFWENGVQPGVNNILTSTSVTPTEEDREEGREQDHAGTSKQGTLASPSKFAFNSTKCDNSLQTESSERTLPSPRTDATSDPSAHSKPLYRENDNDEEQFSRIPVTTPVSTAEGGPTFPSPHLDMSLPSGSNLTGILPNPIPSPTQEENKSGFYRDHFGLSSSEDTTYPPTGGITQPVVTHGSPRATAYLSPVPPQGIPPPMLLIAPMSPYVTVGTPTPPNTMYFNLCESQVVDPRLRQDQSARDPYYHPHTDVVYSDLAAQSILPSSSSQPYNQYPPVSRPGAHSSIPRPHGRPQINLSSIQPLYPQCVPTQIPVDRPVLARPSVGILEGVAYPPRFLYPPSPTMPHPDSVHPSSTPPTEQHNYVVKRFHPLQFTPPTAE